MSYATSGAETSRQTAIYIARVLKGAKPADLPVQQSTKFEFVLNLKTAKGDDPRRHTRMQAPGFLEGRPSATVTPDPRRKYPNNEDQ